MFEASRGLWVSKVGFIFEDDCYTKMQKRLEKAVFKKLEKKGDIDPETCATKVIIYQAALKNLTQALYTSSNVTPLK